MQFEVDMEGYKTLLREHFLERLSFASKMRAKTTMMNYAHVLTCLLMELRDRINAGPNLHLTPWYNDWCREIVDMIEADPHSPGHKATRYSALAALMESPGTHAHDTYITRMRLHNQADRDNREEQRLDGKEVHNWPTFADILANRDLLRPYTAPWFIYTLLVDMKDTCLFRRDLLHNTYLETGPAEGHILQANPPTLKTGHHKASRGRAHRPLTFTLPPQYTDYIRRTFAHLQPGDKVFANNGRQANYMMEKSWVLDDRHMTMNYLRSSLATRFIANHPRYKDQADFARNSGTSQYVLTTSYHKWEKAQAQVCLPTTPLVMTQNIPS